MNNNENLKNICFETLFFERCVSFEDKYNVLFRIWKNLDETLQLKCYEFIFSYPGLKSDFLNRQYCLKTDLIMCTLQSLIRNECKVYSIYSDDENEERLELFFNGSGYFISMSETGFVAIYSDKDFPNKDFIPLSNFDECIKEVNKMIIMRYNKLKNID